MAGLLDAGRLKAPVQLGSCKTSQRLMPRSVSGTSCGANCFTHCRDINQRRPFSSAAASLRRHTPLSTADGHLDSANSASSSGHSVSSRRSTACRGQNGDGGDAEVVNLVIIGSGPAGYTAAIYAARANLRPVVFEGYQAGGVRGGQLMTTSEVENFPGFPEGITGPDLMERMAAQSDRWGAQLLPEDVEDVDLSQRPFVVRGMETTVRCHSIIVATGATAKRLGIPSEEKYWSSGISACAICDGASPGFKNQELAVVGGGDTALEEALYLTKYGKHVHLLVRGSVMRASKTMQDRVTSSDKITVHLNVSIDDAYGDSKDKFAGVKISNAESGESKKLTVKGLFYGIGHQPNSGFLRGQIETDDHGYVKVHDSVKTNVEGVFVAGDLFDTEWRQAITAAGSGCMGALSAERYLAANDLLIEHHQQQQQQQEEKQPEKQAAKPSPTATDEIDLDATEHSGQIALRRLYHTSNRLMLVFYSSPSCGPCRSLKPVVAKLTQEFADKIHLVHIDIEQDPEIAEAAGVNGTPTIHFFKAKARVENLPGVKMKSEYRRLIETHI